MNEYIEDNTLHLSTWNAIYKKPNGYIYYDYMPYKRYNIIINNDNYNDRKIILELYIRKLWKQL